MARGKYAAKAEIRDDLRERDERIRTLTHALHASEARAQELTERLESVSRDTAATIRALRERLDKVASPEVDRLNAVLSELRAEAEVHREWLRRYGDQTEEAARLLEDVFIANGMDADAAIERGYNVLPMRSMKNAGSPDRHVDMTGARSIASGGRQLTSSKLRERAVNGDEVALKQYRAIRNARLGRGPR